VAPPVGDIAISAIDASPSVIDLGTQERVPRLVLRDAPVREVLSLLARAANMNLAYSSVDPTAPGGATSS
jgi:type IV pilus assembly protein PilQ